MRIERQYYLEKLIARENNCSVKIITGLRRCGKSYLLFNLFVEYLRNKGVAEEQMIRLALDDTDNEALLDRHKLLSYVKARIIPGKLCYVMLVEIQLVEKFEGVLNSLLRLDNVDVYVTGSNSKFLSSDIITEFRGRGDEVRVNPLSYQEFLSAFNGNSEAAWREYMKYGGLPLILMQQSHEAKTEYLSNLWKRTYLKDIIERNSIRGTETFDALVKIIASNVGSLTNPLKLANAFTSKAPDSSVNHTTIKSYLEMLQNAFIVEKVERYDIRGKKHIGALAKYYFTDLGLRNALLNFRQIEENHLMENIVYNELRRRGYTVNVGMLEVRERNKEDKLGYKQLEVDFVCDKADERLYAQVALNVETREKLEQEQRPYMHFNDNFKKMLIVKGSLSPWHSDDGVLIMGLQDFLIQQ